MLRPGMSYTHMAPIENSIFRLRKKLEPDPRRPAYIKTVFRVGYKIDR